jgi:hypothetical protein
MRRRMFGGNDIGQVGKQIVYNTVQQEGYLYIASEEKR